MQIFSKDMIKIDSKYIYNVRTDFNLKKKWFLCNIYYIYRNKLNLFKWQFFLIEIIFHKLMFWLNLSNPKRLNGNVYCTVFAVSRLKLFYID